MIPEEGVYCVADGCRNLATNDRLVGFANGDPIVELVCEEHLFTEEASRDGD